MNQTFTCEACHLTSAVRIRLYEDARSVAAKIADAHRAKSPHCATDLNQIRAHSQLGIIKAANASAEDSEKEMKMGEQDTQKIEIEDDQRCRDCGSTEAGNCFYCKVD